MNTYRIASALALINAAIADCDQIEVEPIQDREIEHVRDNLLQSKDRLEELLKEIQRRELWEREEKAIQSA